MLEELPGRTCPLRYRYGAAALARAPEETASILYVVGGLYGNVAALNAIEAMAAEDAARTGLQVKLCFNGDFNWFNTDADSFRTINQRVLRHRAIQGNVEAELSSPGDDAGCGCAYPEQVDAGVVERSNRIHARLKATAAAFPELLAQVDALPMLARFRVGGCAVGVVHGDADSLAGWRFSVEELGNTRNAAWLQQVFAQAQVDVFASSHTCEPVLKCLPGNPGRAVINNGAAGMPNFRGVRAGLMTRVAVVPSVHPVVHGTQVQGAYVDAINVPYDHAEFERSFLANWPAGSDAYVSYFHRINAWE
jgi:hypothetical protein